MSNQRPRGTWIGSAITGGQGGWVLDERRTEELAKLADSIAARADAMAERVSRTPFGASGASPEAQAGRAAYRRQAGHAEGVRDVLHWLAGGIPSPMLCDALDLDPEE